MDRITESELIDPENKITESELIDLKNKLMESYSPLIGTPITEETKDSLTKEIASIINTVLSKYFE